jgi:type II secretory pathway pseudopilin PulG
VMVIIGLLMAGILAAYSTHLKREQIRTTADNIKIAQDAIQRFQQDFGYYPCPADPTSPELKATDCSAPVTGGIQRVDAGGGKFIRIGVMPISDRFSDAKLISGNEAVDGWKRRLTYAVTENLAIDKTTFAAEIAAAVGGAAGVIVVNDSTGTVKQNKVNFIVLSHGEDGAGAYSASGISIPCAGGSVDSGNCDGDFTFVDIQDGNGRNYALGSAYMDDYSGYATKTTAQITKECPPKQVMRGLKANGDLICSFDDAMVCPAGQAMVGILPDGAGPDCEPVTINCSPGEALIQYTLGSPPSCIKNMSGSCPMGYVQKGTNDDPSSPGYGQPICIEILTQCPANYVQVGIGSNLSPLCVPNYNTDCPANHMMVGNNADGSAKCAPVVKNLFSSCPAGQMQVGNNADGSPQCAVVPKDAFTNCPAGQMQVGNNADGSANCLPVPKDLFANCPAGQMQIGNNADGSPNCAPIPSYLFGDCPAGQMQIGNNANGSAKCAPVPNKNFYSCPANHVQVGNNADGSPQCAPNNRTMCPAGQFQIGNNSDGSANCISINMGTCPPGQFIRGIVNGGVTCSGDEKVNDVSCPPGQMITAIISGSATCQPIPVQTFDVTDCKVLTVLDLASSDSFPSGRPADKSSSNVSFTKPITPGAYAVASGYRFGAPDIIGFDPDTGKVTCYNFLVNRHIVTGN